MKHLHQLLLALILLSGLTMTAQTEYRFNSKQNGFSVSSKSNSTINIDYNVNAVTIEESSREGLDGQFITLSGIFIPNQAGAPDLPSSSAFVAIPNGAQPSIQLVSSKTKVIENVDLIPAPIPQLDNDDSQAIYEKDMDIYGCNAYYPATPYQISEVMTVRGVEMVEVGVMPFQYNPVTKELIVYSDMELELDVEGGNGTYGDIRYRTPEWDQILSDMLLNREVLPEVDYGERRRKHYENRETGCEYIIITPDNEDFIQLADSIKKFRTEQGIPTEIFTVSQCGGNDQTAIRNFIRNAYNTWDMPPAAVLFLGDHNTDGTQGIVSYTMNNHPGGNGYNPYISDHIYSVMGNNHMPQIILGRITGRNYDEMYHMIKKDLDYERQPPTDPYFYDHPITAMGFQLERWFQLCSEVVNGFWELELGKHPVRQNAIYQGTPGSRWSTYEHTNEVLGYFGPSGCGYIPQTMSHLTDWSATGNSVNEAINKGSFIIQHRDHGAEELWGEPSYSIGNINRLTNTNLTYVMSNNCLTGRFNYGGVNGECFAEAFHRHQYGALGLIAATEVSYSFVNDIYVWGVYDNMWPNFMPTYGTQHATNFVHPAFGNAAGKYFLRQSSWTDDYVKEITYYLFHQHGDTYMKLYTEVPQELEVTMLPILPAGSDQYTVKADEGATICLTANGQVIGFDIATGDTQQINVTPQEIGTTVKLTITKQDYYRYEHLIKTISAEDPYLIFNAIEINDEEGNGNQAPDYNETCKLNISLHNVGFTDIDNVQATLSCQHPKVQIMGSEANFGTIHVGETPMVDNAFKIHFDESLDDGETVRLFLDMGNCSHVYRDSIDLKINAPVLSCTNVSFSDLDGEPTDRFIRGESTLMTFELTNLGHSKSLDLTNTLSVHAPFLDIPENSFTLDALEADESAQVTFQVNLHDDAPKGNILSYALDGQSGVRTIHYEDNVSLGYAMEDFEDEELNPNMEWSLGSGSKKWHIVEDPTATEGHCMRSPSLNDNGVAKLMIGVNCSIPETFTFNHKTSTEEGDQLQVIINSNLVATYSGETDWEQSTFDLKEGQNLINFTFKKNAQDSGGEDCVMIDHLLFPPTADLFVFAGDNTGFCPNGPITPNSCVLNQYNILWSTSGDGTFDDPNLEQPTYTPGANDIASGHVVLSLTATSSLNFTQETVSLELTELEDLSGIIPEKPIGDTEVDLRVVSQTSYRSNLDQTNDYQWTLSPENAGEILPDGNQTSIAWNSAFRGNATLSYRVGNDCDYSEASTPLDILVTNSTSVGEISGNDIQVYPNPTHGVLHIKADNIPSGEVVIRLIDGLGRIVFMEERSLNGVVLEEQINTANLRNGLYDLQIIYEGQAFNTRVILH